MVYVISGKGITVTEGMKTAAENVLGQVLGKFLGGEERVTVTAEKQNREIKTSVMFRYAGELVKISESGEDYYAGLDSAADILKTKLERLHDRNVRKEHGDSADDGGNEISEISKRKFIDPSPMPEKRAAERMNLLGYNAFLFSNEDMDGASCMMYRREDGTLGIIETAMGAEN